MQFCLPLPLWPRPLPFPAWTTQAGYWPLLYGWTEENGQLAYYDEDGYLTTDSWRKNGDDWYYLDEEGSIARNQKIDDYYVGKTEKW